MPGKQVKDWSVYHALRRKGHSKESAAKITNSKKKRKKTDWRQVERDGR